MARIVIDAGHGMNTPGKRCLKSLDSAETREWFLNDRVADFLALYLISAGHTVKRVDDTTGKTDVSLANRCAAANNWSADLYLSVHHNAGAEGTSSGGLVVYVCPGCSAKSRKLQDEVYKKSVERAKLPGNRWDGTLDANFYVLKNTNMPAILIECGFMDSKVDIKYILDEEWSKDMALGIAEGVCKVVGGTVKTGAVTPEKDTSNVYRVQVGAYSKKENAYAMLEKLKKAGFEGFIK